MLEIHLLLADDLRACNGSGAMIHEFGGDSVDKRFSSQTNQGLISLEQMVVVVFTVGEMKDMLTVVLSRGTDLAVVASWSGVV
jgi:hypothetical protein